MAYRSLWMLGEVAKLVMIAAAFAALLIALVPA